MKKMIKQFLLLVSLLMLIGGGSIYAAWEGNVYDDAALLTDSEISALNEQIAELQEQSGWNVYAVTTNDAGGKQAEAYADDFFDTYSPEQEDGIVALIDMEHRKIWISTCGEAVRYLTDDRIENILDDAFGYVSDGNYASSMEAMIAGAEKYYQSGIPKGQYNHDTETGKKSVYRTLTVGEILIALLLGIGAGAVVFLIILGKYRLKFGTYQYEFHNFGKIRIKNESDRLVNQTMTHRRIPQNTDSGGGHGSSGGSSTHTSSSGRSHGGGGRSF